MIRTLHDIIEILREQLSNEQDGVKIYDRNIAAALGITQSNFGAMKVRDKIPYEEIIAYAENRALSLDKIFVAATSTRTQSTSENTDPICMMHDDSMHPQIQKGDTLYYDPSSTDFSNGGLFVIRSFEEIYIRTIHKRLNATIDLIPYNSAYPTENTLPTHIEILGEVSSIRRSLLK
jgi:phage repressor protein C with HTH and peptisase S24 domain